MSLLDLLTQQLGNQAVGALASQLGADSSSTQKAVTAALPALVGALARNAANPQGAAALAGALDRDHDGGVLENLTGFLGARDTSPGDGILGHVLGQNRPAVETNIAKSSGLDAGMIAKLLPMLAPLVMGALGSAKKQGGLDAGALAGMLAGESQRVEQSAPGILGKLLDSDGDGDVMDDVMKLGAGVLGGFLKR